MFNVLATARAQSGFFTSDDIFRHSSLSPLRKVLEFEYLSFYVLAPYRSLSVLPRDPCSCIGVISSKPHRMLLRGILPPSQGDRRPSCMHSMMSLLPCLILGRQHRKHMGPWPSTFKDCAYNTREASPCKVEWKILRSSRTPSAHDFGLDVTWVPHRSSQRSPSPNVIHSLDSNPDVNIAHLHTSPKDKAIHPRHRSRCIDLPHRTVVARASGSFPEQRLSLWQASVSKPGDVFAEFHSPWATAASLVASCGHIGRAVGEVQKRRRTQ
ncbi:hypothetical protein M413DRAFT_383923 [Hebeloma cylindrosporum]|uniref:Uncharacterized protein n=1 Tax=Hebeloma cylindrosporum TaxID=76867 RepID=A0A0C2Y151_HEBCY|nr:hypothetical protein M413DRAFT_383923 [Hebeloma cylindrosporum h7]